LIDITTPTVPEPRASALEHVSMHDPHDVLRALDTYLPSRRVLARYGLHGAEAWTVPNGTSPTSVSQIYFERDGARVLMRAQGIELTPGSLVRLDVVSAPAGPTQRDDGGGGWELDDVSGRVRATITYSAPAPDVDTSEINLVVLTTPSPEPAGGEPANIIAALTVESKLAIPAPLADDPAEWRKWTRPGVTVDLVLELLGSPRIVDVALVEQPFATTSELDDQPWAGTLYANDVGDAHELPLTDWPQTQASSTDRGDGVVVVAEAIAAHGDELGPVLVAWTSASEADTLADWLADGEAVPFVATGTIPQLLSLGIEPDAEAPAWATGSHGAPLLQSGDDALGRRTAVLPVMISAYMRLAGTGTGYLRVETSDWDSYVMETSSLVWAWIEIAGWLEVGPTPEDQRKLRAYAYTSVGGLDIEVRYVVIRRRSNAP
jgi:hypothetical protein